MKKSLYPVIIEFKKLMNIPQFADSRRKFVIAIAFLLFTTIAHAAELKGSRPNIIWLYADDHAVQALSAYGGRLAEIAPTPNLDRLAQQGMRILHGVLAGFPLHLQRSPMGRYLASRSARRSQPGPQVI